MKLRNQEIHLAYPNLEKLAQIQLPIKVSLGIATLISKLRQPYLVIEGERQKLVRKYGTLDPKTKQINVSLDSPQAGDFAREYGELLIQEWEDDIKFTKVILPQSLKVICEGCKQQKEIPFVMDSNTLLPLREKFIDVI